MHPIQWICDSRSQTQLVAFIADIMELFTCCICGLQCFDAVGWAAGRASGL